MEKLIVLVDMDDVLESLSSAWVCYLNNRHGTVVKLSDITDWDMARAFPTLTDEQIYAPLLEDGFWDWVKPIDGAQKYLRLLMEDGHKVVIVTASGYRTIRAKMERVLFKCFPFLTWDDVIITSNKQLIKGDVLIDDGVHNLVGGSYYKILMDAPHNRGYDAEANGMFRATTWEEVYSAVTLFANNEMFRLWRDKPSTFAEEYLGMTLNPVQKFATNFILR